MISFNAEKIKISSISISSVNFTKSAISFRFRHILFYYFRHIFCYWRNHWWKIFLSVQCLLQFNLMVLGPAKWITTKQIEYRKVKKIYIYIFKAPYKIYISLSFIYQLKNKMKLGSKRKFCIKVLYIHIPFFSEAFKRKINALF